MATRTLIIQNLTSSPITIDDLGIYIPADGAIEATMLFAENRAMPFESVHLTNRINANELAINDGSMLLNASDSLKYLAVYMVASHDVLSQHNGNMLENNISPDGVLARTNLPAIITEPWRFNNGGRLAIENGNTLPAGFVADGRLFWDLNDKKLFAGAGNVWNNTLVTQNSRYNAPVIYEYGAQNTLRSGAYLSTAWAVSTSTPVIVPLNGTLRAICAHSSANNAYTCSIRKLVGTTWTTIASVSAATSARVALNNGLSINFDAGDKLACQVSSGRMTNAHCYIEVVWRQ